MKNSILLQNIFVLSLFVTVLISFYFFIDVLMFKNKDNSKLFNTWQFPMLLAIYIDIIYSL